MADIKYTDSQAEAIHTRGDNVLVSAAAGSGKTRVLVDRIISFILDEKIPLRQMLVVTFTNAAAGEMKERLAQGLQDALVATHDPDSIRFLRQQLQDLPSAHVSTMHAFCSVELRRYHHYLSLNPDYSILIAQQADKLRNQVFDQLFEDAYEADDADFLSLVEAYGSHYNDETLRSMVRALVFMAESKTEPEKWLENLACSARQSVDDDFMAMFWVFYERQLSFMNEAVEQMHQLVDGIQELESYAGTLINDEKLYDILRNMRSDTIENVISFILPYELSRLKTVPAKYRNEFIREINLFKLHRENGIKEPLKVLKGLLPLGGWEQIKNDRRISEPHIDTICRLASTFIKNYSMVKRKKNVLDFSDLEHQMLMLLKNQEVLDNLKSEIQYIFFDEYQDANPIQEEIVQKLGTPGQLFFVGDVKQAIYRFRQADPALFNRRYRLYRDNVFNGRLIHLAENFRSRQEILNFSNQLFGTLMTPERGAVDYLEPGQSLICGVLKEPKNDAVTIALIDHDSDEIDKNEAEALWIGQEIKRLVERGEKAYKDIAILLRVPSSSLASYQSALDNMKIPYYSDNSLVNFNNMEVRLFIDFLRVIDNSELDDALIAALTSPFGGMTDSQLAAVRVAFPEGRFSKAIDSFRESFPDSDEAQRYTDFKYRIEAYRMDLKMMSLTDFADRLLNDSGYADFLKSLDNGEERYRNVSAFIDLIADFETDNTGGLYAFLLHIDALKNRSNDNLQPAIALGQEDDCVRIMSIHKSKGLGFDTVFLGDMTHRFNFRDVQGQFVLHPDFSVAPEIIDVDHSTRHSSFEKRLLTLHIKEEIKSEEVRLFYVAMTRAIDRLYLVGAETNVIKKLEKAEMALLQAALDKGNSFADWLYLLIAQNVISSDGYNDQRIKTSDLLKNLPENNIAEREFSSLSYDKPCVEFLNKTLSFRYPYESETVEPYKKTVSQLSKENRLTDEVSGVWPSLESSQNAVEMFIPRPDFLSEQLHFTAAEQGTIAHKAMQLLPLQKYTEDELEAAIEKLAHAGLISLQESKEIDRSWILRFFNSDMGKDVLRHVDSVEREVPFTMFYDNHLVDGQIDLFYHTDEGYRIIDFKTDRVIDPQRYVLQLSLYKKALTEARGEPVVDASIYWLRHSESSKLL